MRTPATVTAARGDRQQADPGATVSIAPTVVVRDAQARPLAGVTVTFAIAAGGGVLEGGTTPTDSTGEAHVSRWQLGTTGEQQLTASVSGLPAVTFSASLTPGVVPQLLSVSPVGGRTEIVADDHPYRGLTLTVPAGALAVAASWEVRVRSNASTPTLPSGYRLAGPPLEISTDAARAQRLMTLSVPVRPQSNERMHLAFFDPARNVLEVLPTVALTDTSVSVMTAHLRGDLLLGPPQPASLRRGLISIGSPGLLLPIAQLIPIVPPPPAFEISRDSWPVREVGSALAPFGHGAAIPSLVVVAKANAIPNGLAGLFRASATPGYYLEMGHLRAVIAAQEAIDEPATRAVSEVFAALLPLTKRVRDEMVDANTVAAISLSRLPIVVARLNAQLGAVVGSIAYQNAVTGTEADVTSASALTNSLVTFVRNTAGRIAQVARTAADTPPFEVGEAIPLSSFLVPFERMAPVLSELRDYVGQPVAVRASRAEQIAAALGLPASLLEQEAVRGGGWAALPPFVQNAPPMYLRMPQAALRAAAAAFPANIGVPQSYAGSRPIGSAIGISIDELETALGLRGVAQSHPLESLVPTEGSRFLSVSTVATVAGMVRQLRPMMLEVRRSLYRLSPDTVRLNGDTLTASVQASLGPAFPPGGRIDWSWGDGASTSTSVNTATHTYAASGQYKVVGTLRDATGNVLGVDTSTVIGTAVAAWRLNSISDLDELLDPDELSGSSPLYTAIQRLVSSPEAGLISIDSTSGSTTAVRLRVLSGSTWSLNNCCPAATSPLGGEFRQILGEMPATTYAVGPFFAGFNVSQWSQTSPNLSTGTLLAQFVDGGLESRMIRNRGTQLGPRNFIRLTASRNGTQMTGTITIYAWFQDEKTGLVPEDELSSFRLAFTATRLR
ncbi:hypothetical protein MASR1M101_12200 [Gemmatimonas sp.]